VFKKVWRNTPPQSPNFKNCSQVLYVRLAAPVYSLGKPSESPAPKFRDVVKNQVGLPKILEVKFLVGRAGLGEIRCHVRALEPEPIVPVLIQLA
jgi:hypothetical protein